MKRIIKIFTILIPFILLSSLVSCKKEYKIEDYLGSYIYDECIYSYALQKEVLTTNNKDKTFFEFNSNSFKTYELVDSKKEARLDLDKIEYQKQDKLVSDLDSSPKGVKALNKLSPLARFDLYRNARFQGYSLIITKQDTYLLDIRKADDSDNLYIYAIIKLKK